MDSTQECSARISTAVSAQNIGKEINPIQFVLTMKESEKIREWIASRSLKNAGAAGGRYTYHITPTNIGLIVNVEDVLGKETLDVTDWSDW